MLLLQNTNFLEISFRTRMHRDTQAGSNSVVVHSLKTAVLGTQIIFILDHQFSDLINQLLVHILVTDQESRHTDGLDILVLVVVGAGGIMPFM